jgi:hypothetical protein
VGAWFPPDAFDNFQEVLFLNIEVLIPARAERVLETAYGEWRTPVTEYHWDRIPNWLHVPPGAEWPSLPASANHESAA